MMPTDRLTIRSTIFESSANEKTAAAVMENAGDGRRQQDGDENRVDFEAS